MGRIISSYAQVGHSGLYKPLDRSLLNFVASIIASMSHITSEYVDTYMNNKTFVSKGGIFFSMSDACLFCISYHLLKILFSSSDAGPFGSLVYYLLFIECGYGGVVVAVWRGEVGGRDGGVGRFINS